MQYSSATCLAVFLQERKWVAHRNLLSVEFQLSYQSKFRKKDGPPCAIRPLFYLNETQKLWWLCLLRQSTVLGNRVLGDIETYWHVPCIPTTHTVEERLDESSIPRRHREKPNLLGVLTRLRIQVGLPLQFRGSHPEPSDRSLPVSIWN